MLVAFQPTFVSFCFFATVIIIVRTLIPIGIKQDTICNNLTTQNQPLIFYTLTNENEKTPPPKTVEPI